MLKVRFFAAIRERIGRSVMELSWDESSAAITGLVRRLESEIPGAADALLEPRTLVAVNREIVTRQHTLRDGDEVAFYPPVTGG